MGFGDIRLARRVDWLVQRIVTTGSVVLRRLGGDRAGEIAAHRVLDNDQVDAEAILEGLAARTREASAGRRVVAVQDTSEVNFAGRSAGRSGLGPGGDGRTPGFFIHPLLVVDAEEETVLGVAGARLWSRPATPAGGRGHRPLEDKESERWLEAARFAGVRLDTAAQVVVVADREGDLYPLFARRPDGVDLVVRAAQNRCLATGGHLFDATADWPELGRATVTVAPKPGQPGRCATVALRAGTVTLARPRNGTNRSDPAQLTMALVEAVEVAVAAGVTPLCWRLLTTLPISGPDAAACRRHAEEVVRLYRLRWRIEELFRVLKRDGLKFEDTQVETAGRLFKLAACALGAAGRIIQLRDARDGSPRPATDVIDDALLDPVDAIGRTLEGRTKRQQNPHAKGSLAWLAWITARLGGWNCYYKPPGPKTIAQGWQQLASMLAGYVIANAEQDV